MECSLYPHARCAAAQATHRVCHWRRSVSRNRGGAVARLSIHDLPCLRMAKIIRLRAGNHPKRQSSSKTGFRASKSLGRHGTGGAAAGRSAKTSVLAIDERPDADAIVVAEPIVRTQDANAAIAAVTVQDATVTGHVMALGVAMAIARPWAGARRRAGDVNRPATASTVVMPRPASEFGDIVAFHIAVTALHLDHQGFAAVWRRHRRCKTGQCDRRSERQRRCGKCVQQAHVVFPFLAGPSPAFAFTSHPAK